ncbi:MAG: hypothetical protein ACI8P0_004649 [Planctomycetaceae bacterium]
MEGRAGKERRSDGEIMPSVLLPITRSLGPESRQFDLHQFTQPLQADVKQEADV